MAVNDEPGALGRAMEAGPRLLAHGGRLGVIAFHSGEDRIVKQTFRRLEGAGFTALELVSTLPGEPLYLASGFAIVERFELNLPGDVRVPVARMRMAICGSVV